MTIMTYFIIIADNGMVVGTLEVGERIETYKRNNSQFVRSVTYPITKEVANMINNKFNFVKQI